MFSNGDFITLKADNGQYIKRYNSIEGHVALVCYQNSVDDFSIFQVQKAQNGRIHLIADNRFYCKRFCCWNNMSIVTMETETPDIFSFFELSSNESPTHPNRVSIKAENGTYLKRFCCYEDKSVIVMQSEFRDEYSFFDLTVVGHSWIESK